MASDEDILQERMQSLCEMYNRGDAEGIMKEYYLPESLIMPASSPPVSGQDAVTMYRWLMKEKGPRIEFRRHDVKVSGEWASDRGSYGLYGEDGKLNSSGTALAVWTKRGGKWYLYWDMFTEGGSLTDTADDVPTSNPFVLQSPQKPKDRTS